MDKHTAKNMEHYAYQTPHTMELKELGLIPYRTNDKLEEKIRYLFSHPTFKHYKLFAQVASDGSKGLVKDMGVKAVGLMRHFLMFPQQYGHAVENIHMQLLIRMWRQTYRHRVFQRKPLDEYYATSMRLLSIENGLIEELIRTCDDKDYVTYEQYNDLKRPRGERRRGMEEGSKHFEYLCSLE